MSRTLHSECVWPVGGSEVLCGLYLGCVRIDAFGLYMHAKYLDGTCSTDM